MKPSVPLRVWLEAPSMKAALERESDGSASVTLRHLERRSPWQLNASWERPSPSSACSHSPAPESAASLRPSRRFRSRSSPPLRGSTSNTTWCPTGPCWPTSSMRSEEHTSELQSRLHLVCRLLLEKKKKPPSTVSHDYHPR